MTWHLQDPLYDNNQKDYFSTNIKNRFDFFHDKNLNFLFIHTVYNSTEEPSRTSMPLIHRPALPRSFQKELIRCTTYPFRLVNQSFTLMTSLLTQARLPMKRACCFTCLFSLERCQDKLPTVVHRTKWAKYFFFVFVVSKIKSLGTYLIIITFIGLLGKYWRCH
jgi:hypothetical protein